MDLGNILGTVTDVARTYRTVQNFVDPQGPAANDPTIGDRVGAVLDSSPGTTFLDPMGPPDHLYSNGNGRRNGCRRRRRRLLTKSDLGDIAALKGIVGVGKNFENILAAAMYRSR